MHTKSERQTRLFVVIKKEQVHSCEKLGWKQRQEINKQMLHLTKEEKSI